MPIQVLLGAKHHEVASLGIRLTIQYHQLALTLELVDVAPGKIAAFALSYKWVRNDHINSRMHIQLLLGMQLL